MVDVIEISAIVTAVGVLLGVAYYALEMREQTTIRQTGLMVTLYSWVQSEEYQKAVREVMNSQFKDYEDCVKKYGSSLSDAHIWRALTLVLSPMDMVGTLLFRKRIDARFAFDLWGVKSLEMLYEKVEPLLLGLRSEFGEPGLWVGFEYMKDELAKKEPQLSKAWKKYMSQRSLKREAEMKKEQRGAKSG